MRYIDADKLIKTLFPIGLIDDGKYTINAKAVKYAIDNAETADVVPRAELAVRSFHDAVTIDDLQKKLVVATETLMYILSDLKKEIHDRAVYPHNAGISPYVSLKVVDALISNLMSR